MKNINNGTQANRFMATRKLTIRQVKFIDCYVRNGGNASKAALQAGYSHRQRGWELVSKSFIWEDIAVKTEIASIEKSVVERLRWALEATKIVIIPARCILHNSVTGSEIRVSRRKMAVVVPDNSARLKAIELVALLKGHLKR